jgi:membrane protein implicated in regulation of membrane protease activity
MEQWRKPMTVHEQSSLTDGLESELARYHAGRDIPAPYIAPKPVEQKPVDLKPTAIITAKVGIFAVGATVVGSVCVAIASGIAAFATAYAVEIGALAAVVVVAALVVGGLLDSGTRGDSGSVAPKQEAKQTTINIHVNAAGGNVEVKQQ